MKIRPSTSGVGAIAFLAQSLCLKCRTHHLAMSKITVEEVSKNLPTILEQVAKGEEVLLVQDGKIVARIVPPLTREEWIERAEKLRQSIQLKGEPMSQTVIKMRSEERY